MARGHPGSSVPIDGAVDTLLAGMSSLVAPRQTLVRTATGRDAATDTAFLDNHQGAIALKPMVVTAVVDGDLPRDSIDELVSIG